MNNTDNAEKKIAFFDLDGTLIGAHIWLGIVKHHFKFKENRFLTFRYLFSHFALIFPWKMRLISTERYYRMWGKDMSKMVKGIKIGKAKEFFSWLCDEYLLPTLKNEVVERLKEHQKNGFLTILASGSFQELLEVVSDRLNFDFAIGTELEVAKDKFSGRIIPPLCFNIGKSEKIKNFLEKKNIKIDFKESFAYSDGFFDLPMLKLVGNPVAVDPDKKLLEFAKNKNWQII